MRFFSPLLRGAFSLLMLACALGSPPAMAQLEPVRLYNGVNRPLELTLSLPEGVQGKVEISLLQPGIPDEISRKPATVGVVYLDELFPIIWTSNTHPVVYAQLVVGGTKIGSPVVLQPMLSPPVVENVSLTKAVQDAFDRVDRRSLDRLLEPHSPLRMRVGSGEVGFRRLPEQPAIFSGFRAYTDRHIVFETTVGELEIQLRPDQAPNTCWNMIHLAENGFYKDIKVHRIFPRLDSGDPFVVQFGDPVGSGEGGPGYWVDLEQSSLEHDFGVVSMARSNEPNSNGSQVFFCLSRAGCAFLDGNYTSFAQTVRGADTLLAFENTPVVQSDKPIDAPLIRGSRTVPAPPYGEGPKPVTRPTPDNDR